jgi:hypothetical protein
MKGRLAIIAHQFCSEYFCDSSLDQREFLLKVDALLIGMDDPEDKLFLLNDVIRISKLYYCSGSHKINAPGYHAVESN